ncbi:MAG: DUF1992 domain-containing protein [Hyphomonas sp.]|uniref:DnaJ family domain-containing protein n=1 Tax=Hyphomonas sp. TaxID=87 RepID=UPI00352873D7
MKFRNLTERQILKAQQEGQFENLKGAGKPLELSADTGGIEAIGYRIMAEAGALPREIELRKKIEEQRRVLRETTDEHTRKQEAAKLAELQLRLDMEQEARRRFFGN